MGIIELIILAIGLSMDAFAIAICKGLSVKKVEIKHYIITGIWFGGFQALMPLIGFILGANFVSYVSEYDHWIAFILLFLIGLNMIIESRKNEVDKKSSDFSFSTMLMFSIANSIDALAAGITLGLENVNIWSTILLIGIITFIFSVAGLKIGNKFGIMYKSKAEITGGVILILIGVRILVEHLL